MKGKSLRKMLVMLLSVVMIAAMFPATVFAAGNTYSEATKISFNKEYTGEMSDTNSIDWYQFTLTSSGSVTINVQANMQAINYAVYSGSKAEEKIYSTTALWNKTTQTSNNTYEYVFTAGTYYFCVSQYNYLGTKYNGKYSFTVTYEDSKESFVESGKGNNNSIDTAVSIKLNTAYKGCVGYNDNDDFYKFVLPSDSTVSIATSANVKIMYYYLYDSDGKRIQTMNALWDSVAKKSSKTFSFELSKGTYYFVANSALNQKSYWGSYTFTISPVAAKSGWQKENNNWYYYNAKGTKATGWLKEGSNWFYLDTQGVMLTGWQNIDSNWYYFDKSGIMQTGWKKIGLVWYYLRPNGAMQTGWLQLGDKWYYMNSLGIMLTGWQRISGKWYYFDNSGAMKTGWMQVGSAWYYLTDSGAMATGWQKVGKDWYYFESTGIMVTGNKTIDGKAYKFDSSGRWIP